MEPWRTRLTSDLRPSLLQKTTPGPPFGTSFGRATSDASGSRHQPVGSCPEVLEMRQLFEHRPLGAEVADAVDARLKVRPPQRSSPGSTTLGPPQMIHELFAGRTTWRL